jgi:hypothetical protein
MGNHKPQGNVLLTPTDSCDAPAQQLRIRAPFQHNREAYFMLVLFCDDLFANLIQEFPSRGDV